MATFIQAVAQNGPRLKRLPRVRPGEIAIRLAGITGVRKGEVTRVLYELQAAMQHYHRRGASVELMGIGTFMPTMRTDGTIRIHFRPDRAILKVMGNPVVYEGAIVNRENIGLSPAEYKALWDAEHPDDPLELPLLAAATADDGTVVLKAKRRRRW